MKCVFHRAVAGVLSQTSKLREAAGPQKNNPILSNRKVIFFLLVHSQIPMLQYHLHPRLIQPKKADTTGHVNSTLHRWPEAILILIRGCDWQASAIAGNIIQDSGLISSQGIGA